MHLQYQYMNQNLKFNFHGIKFWWQVQYSKNIYLSHIQLFCIIFLKLNKIEVQKL